MLVGIVNTQRQTEDEVFFQNFTGQNLFFFFFLTERHIELWEMLGWVSVGKLSQ